MTAGALGALAAAGVLAVADWWAVWRSRRRAEYVLKPAVMLAIIAAALALRPAVPAERGWFLAALILGLAGDIFLMLPRNLFLAGLLAFLAGHIAYIAGFATTGLDLFHGAAALAAVVVVAAVLVPRVLRGLRTGGHPTLVPPIVAYIGVIGLMVSAAAASRAPLAVVPAALFFASDTLIAFNRFVSPKPWMPVTIMVTYHLAQAGLVASLVL